MGKIAFVFPGQGAQFSGMGKDLYDNSPEARAVFDMAEGLFSGIKALCFEGSEDDLKETKNTQPCLFTVELAAAAALSAAGIKPDMAAGFSLGEVAALAVSGAVDEESGFKLVIQRGALMQQAAEEFPAAMAAVMKLENEKVVEICSRFDNVYPVNFNCPGQVSVSGPEEKMPELKAAVKASGGILMPIKVKGGFHSPFMAKAADGFKEVLADTLITSPAIPLYSNYTGEVYSGCPKELLFEQIRNPVKWEKIVLNMIAAGSDTFLEVGPGHTLTGFIRKINGNVSMHTVCSPEDIAAIRS